MLGEVEETIYAVDDEEEESDEVKVCEEALSGLPLIYDSNAFQDYQQEIRNVVCKRSGCPIIQRREGCLANSLTGDSVVLISPQVPF